MGIINTELVLRLFNIIPLSILITYFAYIAYTDYNYRKIPDKANLALIISRFLLIPLGFDLTADEIWGALAMFVLFFTVAFKFNMPIGGDIKAATVTALYLGIGFSIVVNIGAILVSLIWYFWFKDEVLKNNMHIPYGTMLMISFGISMLGFYCFLK